jgi:hypothetical protein
MKAIKQYKFEEKNLKAAIANTRGRMRTFEGTITIKWYKNDWGGDKRPITIDVDTDEELNLEKKRIENAFMTEPENDKLPYSVKLELRERK